MVPTRRSDCALCLAPIMVFGISSLPSRQARRLALLTLMIFALAMAVAVVLPTTAALAGQVSRLRTRLREQRAALRDTLERLEQLVCVDALTGLCNRRAMQERLDLALSLARACTWDAGLLLARAIPVALKTARPGTREFRSALRDALEGIRNLPVSNGVTNMPKNDHLGLDQRARVGVQVVGGAWKVQ